MAQPNILSVSDTRLLLQRVWIAESNAIETAEYPSSTAKLRDSTSSKRAHDAAVALLDQEQFDAADADPEREAARVTIWEYVRGSLRNAVESIRNMDLRAQYIERITENAAHWRVELGDATDVDEVRAIAQRAAAARNATLELTRAKLSQTALNFSKWFKEEGLTFPKLLDRYARRALKKRNTPEPAPEQQAFGILDEDEQMSVYAEIVKASGRSDEVVNAIAKVAGDVSVLDLIVIVGAIAWDVAESSNPIVTSINDALELGAGVVGGVIGTAAGVAIGAAGGPFGIFIGGLVMGIIGSFAAGSAAEDMLGSLESAFRYQIPDALSDHSVWGNPVPYVPQLPDGVTFSRQFAY